MLSLIEKAYIRDLLDVPMAGVPTGGFTAGYRYLGRIGQLEYYMNNLGVEEESVITGRPIGVLYFTGDPVVGQSITVTVSGVPCTFVTTAATLLNPDPRGSAMAGVVQAINSNANGFYAGRVNFTPSQAGAQPTTLPTFGQLLISGQTPCNLSVQCDPLGMNVYVQMQGNTYPEPSLDYRDVNGVASTKYGYINVCLQLRKDIISARTNLGLASAGAKGDQGGATFRPSELADRVELFRYFTTKLGNALYAGPDPSGRGGSGGRIII